MQPRFDFIDSAKAIGIIAVVASHAPALSTGAVNFLYSFHIPLFFFISGFLMTEQKLSIGFRAFATRQAKGLLLPYLIFFAVSFVYWALRARLLHDSSTPWPDALAGVLWANGDALVVNITLWFFPALFSTIILFRLLSSIVGQGHRLWVAGVISFAAMALLPSLQHRLPWCIDNALVALVFYTAGFSFQRKGWIQSHTHSRRRPTLLGFGALGFLLTLTVADINGRVDLNAMVFGAYPPLYFLGAALGIFTVVTLSLTLPSNRLTTWLSRNTLTIFPLHLLMFGVLTAALTLVFHVDRGTRDALPGVLPAYVLLAILMCYPAALILARLFPGSFANKT